MFDRMGLSDIKKPLFVVVDDRGRHLNDETGEAAKKLLEMRQAVIARGLPVFDSIESAAHTASKFADFYIRQRQALTSGDSQ
jgi:hypothetical protein